MAEIAQIADDRTHGRLSGAIGGIFGQNYGAGQMDRVQSTYRDALLFCLLYTLVAWGLLMEERYAHLRDAIFGTLEEKNLFRQVLLNAVMATDLMDPELQKAGLSSCNSQKSSKEVTR